MMATETRMVVPKPIIRLFLMDMFLKFICSFPPIFSRRRSSPAADGLRCQNSYDVSAAFRGSSAGVPALVSAGNRLFHAFHISTVPSLIICQFCGKTGQHHTISPYFPFFTSPATRPSTRVTTLRRMMFTY